MAGFAAGAGAAAGAGDETDAVEGAEADEPDEDLLGVEEGSGVAGACVVCEVDVEGVSVAAVEDAAGVCVSCVVVVGCVFAASCFLVPPPKAKTAVTVRAITTTIAAGMTNFLRSFGNFIRISLQN